MDRFPPDIQIIIWKLYFKNHVLLELPKIGRGDFEALPQSRYVSGYMITNMLETVCRLELYYLFKDTDFHDSRFNRNISSATPILFDNCKFDILFENLDEYNSVTNMLCCNTIHLVVTYGWKKYVDKIMNIYKIKK